MKKVLKGDANTACWL